MCCYGLYKIILQLYKALTYILIIYLYKESLNKTNSHESRKTLGKKQTGTEKPLSIKTDEKDWPSAITVSQETTYDSPYCYSTEVYSG